MLSKNELWDIYTRLKDISRKQPSGGVQELKDLVVDFKSALDNFIDFKRILDESPMQFFVTDAKTGTVLYVNPAYERGSTYKAADIVGKNINDLEYKEQLFKNAPVPETLKTQKYVQTIAYNKMFQDPIFVRSIPVFDENGDFIYVFSTDIKGDEFSKMWQEYLNLGITESEEKMQNEIRYWRSRQQKDTDEFFFADPKMLELAATANMIGDTDVTVLITGESGTGKEVLADLIHHCSQREGKPFIKLNCAAIPGQLLESELFGYEAGAFTGADRRGKAGMFELANGGTLLLDEIGEMPKELQVKLLRVLQDQEVRRLGGTKQISLDVRIIASTNKKLEEEIKAKRFRADLYFRLNVLPLNVPPLRDRPADVELLTKEFFKRFNEKYKKHVAMEQDAIAEFMAYQWPGNIRELKNIIERIVVINFSGAVTGSDARRALGIGNEPEFVSAEDADMTLPEARDLFEKQFIKTVLRKYPSRKEAAKVMGIDNSTLTKKCQKLGIE